MAIADLLDLSSEIDLATTLRESPETISRWRAARAVPEEKLKDLIDWAIMEGHLEEVARVAGRAAEPIASAAGVLHDIGKHGTGFQDWLASNGLAPNKSEQLPLTRLLERMRESRVASDDPVTRVRASRAEWDRREERHHRIRAGGRD